MDLHPLALLRSLRNRLIKSGSDEFPPSGTSKPMLWFSQLMGGGSTGAGARVSAANAMKCAAVYACVRVVSEDVAKLPLILYRKSRDGGRKPAIDHPLFKVLRRRPNFWQSSFEWREMMQAHMELRGNAFSFIQRNGGGQILQLLPLHPDRVTLLRSPDGDLFYRISGGFNEPTVPDTVPRADMLHLRAMTLDGWEGLSTIGWMRETIGLALAAEVHASAYFGNGARPDIVISSKTANLTPEQATAIRDAWEKNYRGSAGAYRPAVLPHDLAIEKLSLTNKDSQFLELRGFQVGDIARGFRIPPHKVGDLSNATYSNIEQQGLEYYLDGLMPRLERFEAAIGRDLLTEAEADEYEAEFDFTRILRGDMKSTMEAIGAGRNWGVLSANEGRTWLNLPPREFGDEFLEPLNMVPAGTDRSAAQAPVPPVDAPQTSPAAQADQAKMADNVFFLRRSVKSGLDAA